MISERKYQICNRCVMDTSDPEIEFDDEGNCNLCSEFIDKRAAHSSQKPKDNGKFSDLIAQIKRDGKNSKYDCIIGLSGGVDSSYTALIAKESGLRILAVHLDNGWNSESATLNIKNTVQKLEIDYECYVLDWKEFREIQLAFLKASTPEAETPTDIAILSVLHIYANKYNIKHIVSGGNFASEGILPKLWHYDAKDLKYFNTIIKQFSNIKLKNFPKFGFRKETYYKLIRKIKMDYLLNFTIYNKSEIITELKGKLDWKEYGGKHHESRYTAFIQSYYLFKKFNIDYRRATLSSQICSKSISRNDALKILATPCFDPEKVNLDKQYIAKKLKISLSELEEIIQLNPKWYGDYPNDEKRLEFIYNTYRKLFKKEKLGNF